MSLPLPNIPTTQPRPNPTRKFTPPTVLRATLTSNENSHFAGIPFSHSILFTPSSHSIPPHSFLSLDSPPTPLSHSTPPINTRWRRFFLSNSSLLIKRQFTTTFYRTMTSVIPPRTYEVLFRLLYIALPSPPIR